MVLSFIDLDNDYLIAFEEAISVREILVYLSFSECTDVEIWIINKSQIQGEEREKFVQKRIIFSNLFYILYYKNY